MLAGANVVLQCAAEDEQKEHVSEQVKNASVNQQSGQKSPISAVHQIVEAEEDVLLDKLWVLLPGPEACHDASDYQKRVGSQLLVAPAGDNGDRHDTVHDFQKEAKGLRSLS